MPILITGICGFVGHSLACWLREHEPSTEIFGIDSFVRPGTWTNLEKLKSLGIRFFHGDIRNRSDLEAIPKVDWVIDAAANPSVLGGVDGKVTSRSLMDHNLVGTINMLEFCRQSDAGFILLSTSRVYSIEAMTRIECKQQGERYVPVGNSTPESGHGSEGMRENFSVQPPLSLYGASKLASEILAMEYGFSLKLPVWINRCGVMAGAGQFGRPDQGIYSYWLHSWRWKKPLKYIGFGGNGFQVRDCLHPHDLGRLLVKQMRLRDSSIPDKIFNVSGGTENSASLKELSNFCQQRFGFSHSVFSSPEVRPFDVPWLVLDSRKVRKAWNWQPEKNINSVLEEIATHADRKDWTSGKS